MTSSFQTSFSNHGTVFHATTYRAYPSLKVQVANLVAGSVGIRPKIQVPLASCNSEGYAFATPQSESEQSIFHVSGS